MPVLRFADGVTLNTGGRYRVIKMSDGLADRWYVVGQGHFAPVADQQEGQALWTRLTAARIEERGRLPVAGEPDVYNKRQKHPPPIKEYRVHVSQQNWFGFKVHFLQGGAKEDPNNEDSTA